MHQRPAMPSLERVFSFIRWGIVSYVIMMTSIVAFNTLDFVIKQVMEALGLIPLEISYVIRTGGSLYGFGMLFLRSLTFWTAIQLFNHYYRILYPPPGVMATADFEAQKMAQFPIADKLLL